jgi:hypothetical protein
MRECKACANRSDGAPSQMFTVVSPNDRVGEYSPRLYRVAKKPLWFHFQRHNLSDTSGTVASERTCEKHVLSGMIRLRRATGRHTLEEPKHCGKQYTRSNPGSAVPIGLVWFPPGGWSGRSFNTDQAGDVCMRDAAEFEFNSSPEARAQLAFADDVYIVDSTIRSLQSGVSGSLHTARELVDIGCALDDLGVRELIINLSWKDGLAVCEGLAGRGLKQAKIVGTFRARHPRAAQWAQEGMAAGVDEICFESANDGDHLKHLADPVLSGNRAISHGFAEAYAYPEVVAICRAGVAIGCQSQSFHDSYFRFALTPEGAKAFYRAVRNDVADCPPLYVHLSNFYGNATMTAAAALAGGANAADVCMNGIGHHCGHIQLVELVSVLEALYRVKTGIRLDRLTAVSQMVRRHTGIPMPLTSPVVGDYGFMIDGAYWAAEANIPYEQRIHAKFPIPPGSVGNSEQVVWAPGTITGAAVRARMRTMGLPEAEVADTTVEQVIWELEAVLRQRASYPNWISDREFEQLCRDITRHATAQH